jgi:hypothetical protein
MRKHIILLVLTGFLLVGMPPLASAAPFAGISEMGISDIEISFDGSDLYVNNANGLTLSIYNVAGVKVMSVKIEGPSKRFSLNLTKGCYIVKVGNVARKISVK